jgi:hypothetical protein
MDRREALAFFLLLFLSLATAQNSVTTAEEDIVASENAISAEAPAVKPVARVYPQAGGNVPLDSFHKKSQYIIVASKIIRPNTFYQVGH